jgi:N-acetylmuramoyl-L-alanine amidase-like protein
VALMPGVEHRLLPESQTQGRIRPTQLIFHSIVGSAEGAYGFFRTRSNLESTFIVKKSGHIIQIMDSERIADANFRANARAGSVETEDDGDPNTDPWSSAQLNSLLRIARFYHERHGVPRRQCPAWDAAGYGYHRLFPNQWSVVPGKRCPGDIRVRQYRSFILPAIVSGRFDRPGGRPATGDDAQVLSAEAQRWLNQKFADTNERIIDRTGAVYNLVNAKTGLIPTAAADAAAAKAAAQQAAACCAALQDRVNLLEAEMERLRGAGGTQLQP